MIDVGDAADAEAVIAQLMRHTAGDGEGELSIEGGELFEIICQLLRDFNQSIQDESKDRKYRFVTKKLMRAHQRSGDTLDTEMMMMLRCSSFSLTAQRFGVWATSRRWQLQKVQLTSGEQYRIRVRRTYLVLIRCTSQMVCSLTTPRVYLSFGGTERWTRTAQHL